MSSRALRFALAGTPMMGILAIPTASLAQEQPVASIDSDKVEPTAPDDSATVVERDLSSYFDGQGSADLGALEEGPGVAARSTQVLPYHASLEFTVNVKSREFKTPGGHTSICAEGTFSRNYPDGTQYFHMKLEHQYGPFWSQHGSNVRFTFNSNQSYCWKNITAGDDYRIVFDAVQPNWSGAWTNRVDVYSG